MNHLQKFQCLLRRQPDKMSNLTLTLFLLASSLASIHCACRHSFMTFCDDLEDLHTHDTYSWTEVVFGTETSDASRMRAIDAKDIPLDRFDKLKTLRILRQINDVSTYTFSIDEDDSKLEYLQLFDNEIRRLRYATFDAIKLKKLSLTNNSIEFIHKEAFYNCDIESIDLSYNLLESIDKDVFTENLLSNSTKEIVIRHNRIVNIESDSFPSSLEVLNLDYNKINVLRHDVFDNLDKIQELTLSHNELIQVPNVKYMEEVRILDFSYNKISGVFIKDYNKLENLEILNLGHNKIFSPIIFRDFQFPKRHPSLQISLVFNKLSHMVIGNDSFRDHIVFLYGNPWNCQCWQCLERFLVVNKVKRNPCDLKFFGNGQTPYCIYGEGVDCVSTFPNYIKPAGPEVEEFLEIIKDNEEKINCSLVPRLL